MNYSYAAEIDLRQLIPNLYARITEEVWQTLKLDLTEK